MSPTFRSLLSIRSRTTIARSNWRRECRTSFDPRDRWLYRLEELLGRGVFVTFWPRSLALGYIYPAIGFALWHFAPQVIHPGKLHPAVFVASSLVLGLCWGWVAWRAASLRWTTVSHFFTDGSGLRNALFFLPQ